MSTNKKKLVIAAVIAVLATAGACAWYYTRSGDNSAADAKKRQQAIEFQQKQADDAWSTVSLPTEMKLVDKRGTYRVFDNYDPEGYDYTYSYTGDPAHIFQALKQGLTDAQFTLNEANEPKAGSPDYWISTTSASKKV